MNYIKLILIVALTTTTINLSAQRYSVNYKRADMTQVMNDLRKKTGYEFVAQKQLLDRVEPITCSYKNLTLQQLFNRIFNQHANLDYEIVQKTVIIKAQSLQQAHVIRTVIGCVTDEEGQPLVGATVRVKDEKGAAVTDADGRFSIAVEGKFPVLTVSCIGCKEQDVRVPANGKKLIMITLKADAQLMDEVVVTGYQKLKRETTTGAYNTVTAKEMQNRYAATVLERLEGYVPGMVNYNNGNGSALTIRGVGSFTANTSPLVVVDGLPIEGSVETVNPYDIEHITVLKDAAAASIYGARASNGVIVITTKRANNERLSIDFNADVTVNEHVNYDNFGWATAAEMIELERYNFDYMRTNADQTAFNNLLDYYNNRRGALSKVSRLLVENYLGKLTNAQLESTLNQWSNNNYRKEWQQAMERQQVMQQYNLSLRTKGKALTSSIVLNYKTNNMGVPNRFDNTLTFAYRGDVQILPNFSMALGANVVSQRTKTQIAELPDWSGITAFQPYETMYNADGSPAEMEADVYLGEATLNNPKFGFKPVWFNAINEVNRNFTRERNTNIRSYIHATYNILPEWSVNAQFQYEDAYAKTQKYREGESYIMRQLYNLYTVEQQTPVVDEDTGEMVMDNKISHLIPDGGRLDVNAREGAHYTFRLQTDFAKTFANKHEVEAAAGFEFRQSHINATTNLFLGYDEQSQTNSNALVNFGQLYNLQGTTSALGPNYMLYGAPTGDDFNSHDVLHRFYSLYFTGGYTYDRRYSASVSYRVDKADLFGADPKFRGRPLWSLGASWNLHNERFLSKVNWVDALKIRLSYGLTGNIDQNVSSYLTATVGTNFINGSKEATLNTPPNDVLRWEKTASWNLGVDFSFWHNRLSGSVDIYRKQATDLLATTDLDPTTGWNFLTINNGAALNKGVEVQLMADIVRPASKRAIGLKATLNFAYNRNKVTKVSHLPASGYEALESSTLHSGYPIHALFSYRFAGMAQKDDLQFFTWRDAANQIHYTDISDAQFTPNDIVYSGGLDPETVVGFMPEITYKGFALSAMLACYGGHYMRVRTDDWSTEGTIYGYQYSNFRNIDAVPAAYLNFWRTGDVSKYPANGALGGPKVIGNHTFMDANVQPADYVKLRNLVLTYAFPNSICRSMGIQNLSLRLQMNNVATFVRNKQNIDPEANNPITGTTLVRTPRSFTMGVNLTF